MDLWIGLLAGVILGWLAEWIVDWTYWRKSIPAFYANETQLRAQISDLQQQIEKLNSETQRRHEQGNATK